MTIIDPIKLPESEGGGYTDTTPARLYHYTSQEGLLGILQDGKLHCSSAHYLSDAEEVIYAAELAAKRLKAFWPEFERRNPEIDDDEEMLRGIVREVQALLDSPLYVFSLSVDGNLLSQWRAYCPDEGGYALGFSSRHLQRLAEAQGFDLVRCVYEKDHQRMAIDELIRETVGAYQEAREEGAPVSSELWRRYQVEFLTDFYKRAAAFKDPAFSEEQEFRLVSGPFAENRGNVQYREGPSTPIPYIEFDLREEAPNRLPISGVWVGPTPHPELAKRVLQDLMDRYALPGADVRYSGIPYRTW